MTSQAYLMSRRAADNFSNSFRRVRDENVIESVLSEAMGTGDPNVLQDSISKILSRVSPERQAGAVKFLENTLQNIEKKQTEERKNKTLSQYGIDPNLPSSLQKVQYENSLNEGRAKNIISGNLPNIGEDAQFPTPETSDLSPQSNQPRTLNDLTDQQLEALSGVKGYSEPAKQILKNRRAEAARSKEGDEFKKIREKAVSDYVNNALADREDAHEMVFTINTAKKAINGDIAGPGLEAAIKSNPYTAILYGKTVDEAVLDATNKKLLEGTKSIFGSKPTEREIFLLLNSMLPAIGKTREANLAGLDFIEKANNIKLHKYNLVDTLTDGGTKYVPNLERMVEEGLKPYKEQLHKELIEADKLYNSKKPEPKASKSKNKKGVEVKPLIRVKAPNGTLWDMTQEQIDNARDQNVTFTPV